jgi:aspartyl-tRNA(Asn)/glutamyl-tRNA(Gln) amidotransferase subunit B
LYNKQSIGYLINGGVKISSIESDVDMMCGLEIHVQLNTNSKLFCDCRTNYQSVPPNTNICPVCLNQPGAKPYPTNIQGLKNALMIALMLNCKIDQRVIYFLRKHYDYPDLPSGYQRTSLPIGYEGELNGVRIREIHVEEDPGQFKPDKGIVDFNRSGIPLVEIVTEPDIFSPEQARTFLKELIRVLKYSESARGEGTMRADVNISLDGGKRVEIKNINSIKGAYKALKFEMVRQKNLIKRGIEIQQETRAFVESQMITVSMRLKEDADDYRFIPDPDLPPMAITNEEITDVKENMPETPHNKVKRFIKEYDIDEESAKVLTSELELADAYEEIVKKIDPKFTASWMRDELKRVLYYNKVDYKTSNISQDRIIQLLELLINKEITAKAGQRVVEYMVEIPETPREIAEKLNLIGIVTDDEVVNAVKIAIEENPEAVDDYHQGKKTSMNFLVGQVMKKTRGKADPQETVKILTELL